MKDKDKLKRHGTIFTPIPVRLVTYNEEKAASKEINNSFFFLTHDRKTVSSFSLVDLFQSGKFNKNFEVKPPCELDQVQAALKKLLYMLENLISYVDEVIVR